jgi:subtilisin family serine protease
VLVLEKFRKKDEESGWRPLIVNCSFGLTAPISDENGVPGYAPTDFPVELWDSGILQHMTTSLRELFTSLAGQKDVVVVAAAGNDSARSSRRRTRFPAAYENVIGVGALPTLSPTSTGSYSSAAYSNRADDQNPDEGYMTFGGEPGPGRGIRGLYTSEIPVYVEGWLSWLWRIFTGTGLDGWKGPGYLPPHPRTLTLDRIRYKRNQTGWAWWAGTSFATPIISGFLAAQWSGPCRGTSLDITSAKTQLDQHKQASPTREGEKVIHVEQK